MTWNFKFRTGCCFLLFALTAGTSPVCAESKPEFETDLSPGAAAVVEATKGITAAASQELSFYRLADRPEIILVEPEFQKMFGGAIRNGRKALKLPYRHPWWHPGQSLIHLPLYRSTRILALLFAWDGDFKMARGDRQGAAQSYLDAIDLGRRFSREGALLAVNTGHLALEEGWTKLETSTAEFDAATCRAILKRLAKLADRKPDVDQILRGEQRRLEQPIRWSAANYIPPSPQALEFALKMWQLPRITRVPDDALELAQQMGPIDYFRTLYTIDAEQLQLDILRVRLTLRIYYLENGQYPLTLSQISRRLLPSIPLDPFGNGNPLLYRRAGDSYRLWSIGWDGKDDGGIGYIPPSRPLPDIFLPPVPQDVPRTSVIYRWNAAHPLIGGGDFVAGPNY